ncbi:transglutaminase-like domain-containing protein [Saccharicrinis aurantiacus]|uniref:transglutaminase-like domain-containing protein n=1 Tax=Saccharicrinis aurantiacus TaxID=1849719 RepID=UPI0008380DAB|nr:transglutaminase-like domain-containing protein [Saccharicrinis aurantiacus]
MHKTLNIIALAILLIATSCSNKYSEPIQNALAQSGNNAHELEMALANFKGEQKEALEFLIQYMPKHDLEELSAEYLIENIKYAYIARNDYAWAKNLDKDIFFNEVLPYASLNERRDYWRPDFYKRFSKYVSDASSIEEAIWAVNNNILSELNVEYNTDREKPDQSPYESIELGMASCSGLSILLVDAFRAVGIPARVAGTPNWFNNSGNHNWVEVYVNGQWHFTEYYPSGTFDEAWFLERAGKADKSKPEQWMYASSFKPTKLHFPLVWDDNIKYVHAVDVTDRYIDLYQKELARNNSQNSVELQVVMLKNEDCSLAGNNRVKAEVSLIANGETINSGETSGSIDDMNRYLTFKVEKGTDFSLSFINANGQLVSKKVTAISENQQIILFHNQKI